MNICMQEIYLTLICLGETLQLLPWYAGYIFNLEYGKYVQNLFLNEICLLRTRFSTVAVYKSSAKKTVLRYAKQDSEISFSEKKIKIYIICLLKIINQRPFTKATL